jgi:hypothetical protein
MNTPCQSEAGFHPNAISKTSSCNKYRLVRAGGNRNHHTAELLKDLGLRLRKKA